MDGWMDGWPSIYHMNSEQASEQASNDGKQASNDGKHASKDGMAMVFSLCSISPSFIFSFFFSNFLLHLRVFVGLRVPHDGLDGDR